MPRTAGNRFRSTGPSSRATVARATRLRRVHPAMSIVARGHSDVEVKHLLDHGADAAVMAERELAHSIAEMVMATPTYRGEKHLPPATT